MNHTMSGNRGSTSLRCKPSHKDPMRAYDNLPKDLRTWVSSAILPWGAQSVRRAFDRAIARTGDTKLALRELDALQNRLVAKDAQRIWGQHHPGCCPPGSGHAQSPRP